LLWGPWCPPFWLPRLNGPDLSLPPRLVPALKNSLTPFHARLRGHEGRPLAGPTSDKSLAARLHHVSTKSYFQSRMTHAP
jgi:hypothetical protein